MGHPSVCGCLKENKQRQKLQAKKSPGPQPRVLESYVCVIDYALIYCVVGKMASRSPVVSGVTWSGWDGGLERKSCSSWEAISVPRW